MLLLLSRGLIQESEAIRRQDREEFQERRRLEHELSERLRLSPVDAEWSGTYTSSDLGSLVLQPEGRFNFDYLSPGAECFYERDLRSGTWWIEGENIVLWPEETLACDSFRRTRNGDEFLLSSTSTTWRRAAP